MPKKPSFQGTLYGWLQDLGCTVQESTGDEKEFRLTFMTGNDQLQVVRGPARPDGLLIGWALVPDEELRRRFGALPVDVASSMIREAQFELLRLGVEMEGLKLPIQRVAITTTMFDDGLTKDRFATGLFLVQRGVMLFKLIVNERLEKTPSQAPKDG